LNQSTEVSYEEAINQHRERVQRIKELNREKKRRHLKLSLENQERTREIVGDLNKQQMSTETIKRPNSSRKKQLEQWAEQRKQREQAREEEREKVRDRSGSKEPPLFMKIEERYRQKVVLPEIEHRN